MKCRILHETKGRLRVHLCIGRMTLRQADLLEYSMRAVDGVASVKVYDRTQDAVIEYCEVRSAVLAALSSFSFAAAEEAGLVPEHTGRALNREFEDKLVWKTALHYACKLFLPAYVRAGIAIVRSVRYLKAGLSALLHGKLSVSVLDATAVTVSLVRRDFDTAGSVMFMLGLGELLEDWTHKKSIADLAGAMALNVDRAWVRDADGQELLVSVKDIHAGDCVVVRTGNMIPLDGRVTGGEAMVLQNMFTRPGYEFTGWNTEKNGTGTPYAAGSAITIKNTNVTLYAQWKSSTASYRVEYYQQNLEDDNYSIVADDTLTPSGTVGDTATAEIKEYEGFTYNESRSNSSGIIAEDGTLVLKLYYDRNEYTVTYEYEGTVPAGAPEVPGEQTYKYGETVELAKMPDVTDYRFSGWYSENVALSGGSFTMPDHAVVIKGSFSQLNSYTVTYDLNGGTTTSPQTVFPGLAYGDKTPRIEDPTKEPSELYSYEFTGWSPEIADTVTGDITYRAEYTRTEREFTVTYYLDGTLYAEPESYTYGETVVIKKQAEDATEWTTNDLQESDIIEGLFYMPEHNVVFTATTDGTVTPDECTYTVVYHYVDRDGNEETETDPKDEPSTAGTPVSRLYNDHGIRIVPTPKTGRASRIAMATARTAA